MFDMNIFDLLSTLSIGTFSVVSIIYIVFTCYLYFDTSKHNIDDFLEYLTRLTPMRVELKQSGLTIFAFISVFMIGILIQDFTDHLCDSETSRNPIIEFFKNIHLLNTEGELRVSTLISQDSNLTALGYEIFSNQKISCDSSQMANNQFYFCGSDAKRYWETHGKNILSNRDSLIMFESYINRIYYTSKNWCYLTSEPAREELFEIQTRIDMARSLAIVSFLTFVINLMLFMIYIAKENLKGKNKFKIIISKPIGNSTKTTVIKRVYNPGCSLAIVLTIFLVSRLCYDVVEINYNERALGYYISHFKFKE
jgi:hypothetical protein